MDRPDSSDRVDCSVLVPVLNEAGAIVDSVAAMCRQEFDGRLEFLLADGGSEDGTRELLAQLAQQDPRIKVLENPRRTTPSGLNIGLAHARGRWVCRMDAHTEYEKDYVALGVARLRRSDTRWVSGPPVPVGRGPVSRAVALALRTPLGRGGSRKWAAQRGAADVEYELDSGVFGGVWDRDTLLEYGGWDERWARNQDSEMAGRFLAKGEKLICLSAMAAYYAPRDSLRGLWTQYMQYGEFRERTALRHPHTMRRSHLLAPALVVCAASTVAAPRPIRKLARLGASVYGAALAFAGLRAVQETERPDEAALVPVVLAVMHLAHGVGAFAAATRYGPPLSALAKVLGLRGLAKRLAPAPEPVFAPSLEVRPQPRAIRESGTSRRPSAR
jgi:succinoglycan biosynthesis protein ExoA